MSKKKKVETQVGIIKKYQLLCNGSLILAEIKKHGYDKYLSKLSENDKIANIFDI